MVLWTSTISSSYDKSCWPSSGAATRHSKTPGKSKYYDAALSNFERAMCCYEKAGLMAEWDKTVSQVRAEHHRKVGFLAGFEELVRIRAERQAVIPGAPSLDGGIRGKKTSNEPSRTQR